jgi:hypothetical protein
MVRIGAMVLLCLIPVTASAEIVEPEPTEATPAIVAAEPPPPPPEPNKFPDGLRVMTSDLTILRLNPIGLETRARVGVQKKLYPSPKPITENNFWFAGVYPKLNPASAQLGIGGELQPASIFNVRVLGEVQKYFGTFGYLQSFSSANANYSDQTLSDMAEQGQAATVKHFSVQPMLQLKVGKIALRSLMMFDYWDVPGAMVYEPTFDTLLPDKGWSVATDTDVLYVPGNGLAAGIRHSWVKPMYSAKHFTDAADEAAYDNQNSHHRVGFFGAYTFKDVGPSRFNKPTAILIVSMYVKHKYRAGEPDTLDPGHDADDYRTRAFPYFIAGFAFESDFIDVR